jgi:hypothetical protein
VAKLLVNIVKPLPNGNLMNLVKAPPRKEHMCPDK